MSTGAAVALIGGLVISLAVLIILASGILVPSDQRQLSGRVLSITARPTSTRACIDLETSEGNHCGEVSNRFDVLDGIEEGDCVTFLTQRTSFEWMRRVDDELCGRA